MPHTIPLVNAPVKGLKFIRPGEDAEGPVRAQLEAQLTDARRVHVARQLKPGMNAMMEHVEACQEVAEVAQAVQALTVDDQAGFTAARSRGTAHPLASMPAAGVEAVPAGTDGASAFGVLDARRVRPAMQSGRRTMGQNGGTQGRPRCL